MLTYHLRWLTFGFFSRFRITNDIPDHVPRVYPLRRTVDQFNSKKMDQITEYPPITFDRVLRPDSKEAREVADSMGFEESVVIKIGSLVMLTINLNPENGWVGS